ncbi:hypothetical protein LINPERPRIM_LOCUS12910 [Linum perenne]
MVLDRGWFVVLVFNETEWFESKDLVGFCRTTVLGADRRLVICLRMAKQGENGKRRRLKNVDYEL